MLVWAGLLQRTLVLAQFLMGWLASSYLKNYNFYKKKMLKHAYVHDAVDVKGKWLDKVRFQPEQTISPKEAGSSCLIS